MSGKTYLNNQNFFKPTFHKALEFITPKFIDKEERDTFDTSVDLKDQIINKFVDACSNFSSILPISSVANTSYSSITSLSGIAPYFVKQNELTEISPEFFDLKILARVGKSLIDFETEEELSSYLENTLLPAIRLNNPTSYFTLGESTSSTHTYLIQNLSWLYFLNTSGSSYNPSSYVLDTLTSKLINGQTVFLNDGIKGFAEHIWKNGYTSYYPSVFASSTGIYTSGTQQLDKLKTWIDIIWSPLYSDRGDFDVKNKFDLYLDARLKEETRISDGPIKKFLRAVSFMGFDISDNNEKLKALYDIEDCPAEFLPYMADLIGWKLFGSNPERWRLQLKNAVEVYKRVGTKKSLQFALNSVFPKDQFSIESRVTELWESYIPYLIYYALATESEYLKSRDTWTRSLASELKVVGYSTTSLDENIRLVVDKILLDCFQRFKPKFNIPNFNNEFYYRGRKYPIPPFEEYPYYINVELDTEILNFIADRLVCFGVRNQFALDFIDYVTENTFDNADEIRNNSFLFFTSGYTPPPNLTEIIGSITSNKFEYASLWCGKSSHFKLIFDASEFDFSKKDENDFTSGDAVTIASQIVNEFSPANAIPLVNLQLSSVDVMSFDSDILPIVDVAKDEVGETIRYFSNIYTSGLNVKAYKRGSSTGTSLQRSELNSLVSPRITGASSTIGLARNSLRRRSYEKLLPKDGFYDMTGFNQPLSWDPSASLSGIVLGFIPSSMQFQTVSDVFNLPPVYQTCYGASSNLQVYGYYVSNTLTTLGHTGLLPNDIHCDLGQTPDIWVLMHKLGNAKDYYTASSLYYSSSVGTSSYWFNYYQSKANEYNASSGFPASMESYYNFQFGKDLHKLYQIYTKEFSRHRLAEDLHYLDGANIFAHTFGSIIYNSDFDLVTSQYITSSFDDPISLRPGSLFSASETAGYIDNYNLVNSSIVSGVDLIHTSGSFQSNEFAVVNVPIENRLYDSQDYIYGKTFILSKSTNGLPRVRFDITRHLLPSGEGYPIQSNFLLPDHEFRLDINHLITNPQANKFGGRRIGVWIHTKPELSKVWSYSKDGVWVQHDENLTKADLFSSLTHFLDSVETDRPVSEDASGSKFNCLELVAGNGNLVSPIYTLDESSFKVSSISFNTCNRTLLPEYAYQVSYGQVHRKTQKYIIEVFLIPNNTDDKFLLLDSVNLVDTTMNTLSRYLALDVCPQLRVDLTREDLQTLFKFWNDISGKNSAYGLASRSPLETSSIMYAKGGSRLDYRKLSSWEFQDLLAGSLIYQAEFTL